MTAVLACRAGEVRRRRGDPTDRALKSPEAPVGPILSHRSAAALWRIRLYGGTTVDVTSGAKSRSSGCIRRHYSLLPPDEVTMERGIPVTTVPRTIFDLAATEPPEAVEGMLRESEFLRLYDRLSLPDLLERHPGHRGARAIRACLARREPSAGGGPEPAPERLRSPLEERFVPFLDRHGLLRPRFNAHVEAGGRWHEVDCLWPRQREIVELDGWEGHGTRGAFREDRARDRRLRLAGYGVTRLTWAQLDDEPEAIARDLRRLLYKRL
jgi:very-short-patch-repair endonuclease